MSEMTEYEYEMAMAEQTYLSQRKGEVTLAGRHPKSQEFHELLKSMGEMHDRKQADYGRDDDPFANVRASEDFGIEPWIGCMMRANDKMRRLQTAAQGSTLKNEGVEDSLLDLAVYAVIALVLYRETHNDLP